MHAVVARSTFERKKCQNIWVPDDFWKFRFSSDVEKARTVVAQTIFPSQNAQNSISTSDGCWKLRCRKSARHFGAKHVCKSKCTKKISVVALLEVEMSKKWTPLWREAQLEVIFFCDSMSKKCTPLWRKHMWKSNVSKAGGFRQF